MSWLSRLISSAGVLAIMIFRMIGPLNKRMSQVRGGYDGLGGGKGRKGRSSRCCHQIKITFLPLVLFSPPLSIQLETRNKFVI